MSAAAFMPGAKVRLDSTTPAEVIGAGTVGDDEVRIVRHDDGTGRGTTVTTVATLDRLEPFVPLGIEQGCQPWFSFRYIDGQIVAASVSWQASYADEAHDLDLPGDDQAVQTPDDLNEALNTFLGFPYLDADDPTGKTFRSPTPAEDAATLRRIADLIDGTPRVDADALTYAVWTVADPADSAFSDGEKIVATADTRKQMFDRIRAIVTGAIDGGTTASVLARMEATRPCLDADTSDRDLAAWARECVVPELDKAGLL